MHWTVFSARLREVRQLRNMNQEDLAIKAESQPSTIAHYEAGSRFPSLANFAKLVAALDCSADYLLGRTDRLIPKFEGESRFTAIALCCETMPTDSFLLLCNIATTLAKTPRALRSPG